MAGGNHLDPVFYPMRSQMSTGGTGFLRTSTKSQRQTLGQKNSQPASLWPFLTTTPLPCPRTQMLQKRSFPLKKGRSSRWGHGLGGTGGGAGCLNHRETTATPNIRKNCLPQNQFLMPQNLGTAALIPQKDRLLSLVFDIQPPISSGGGAWVWSQKEDMGCSLGKGKGPWTLSLQISERAMTITFERGPNVCWVKQGL